jgi:hypothetical protein
MHNLKQGLIEKSKLAQHAMKKVIGLTGMRLGSWRLRATVGTGSIRNLLI